MCARRACSISLKIAGESAMNPVDPVPASMSQIRTPNLKGERGVVLKLWIVKGKSWLKGRGFGMRFQSQLGL